MCCQARYECCKSCSNLCLHSNSLRWFCTRSCFFMCLAAFWQLADMLCTPNLFAVSMLVHIAATLLLICTQAASVSDEETLAAQVPGRGVTGVARPGRVAASAVPVRLRAVRRSASPATLAGADILVHLSTRTPADAAEQVRLAGMPDSGSSIDLCSQGCAALLVEGRSALES